MRSRALQALGATAAVGAGALAYGSVVERNWFALRRCEVPVLSPGVTPLRILHISDVHLTPRRHLLMSWIRSLDALEPDLVVNTGDSIGHPQAVEPFMEALGPLLDRPGIFVYGSNDLYSPKPRNPARYLWVTSARAHRHVPDMPWPELGAGMAAAGWLDANNQRGRIKAADLDIEVTGVHDSHTDRDRYDDVAGPADPATDLRPGVMHAPEPRGGHSLGAGHHDRDPDSVPPGPNRPRHRPAPGRYALARAPGDGPVRGRRLQPAARWPHPWRPTPPAVVRRTCVQLRSRPPAGPRASQVPRLGPRSGRA